MARITTTATAQRPRRTSKANAEPAATDTAPDTDETTTTPAPAEQPATETPAPIPEPEQVPVHIAINRVMRDVEAVAKAGVADDGSYVYRSVDDTINALSGPLAQHGVFILPSVTGIEDKPHGDRHLRTLATVEYRIFGPTGDSISTTMKGEGISDGGHGLATALTAALKSLCFQLFAIRIAPGSVLDGDSIARVQQVHAQGVGRDRRQTDEERAQAEQRRTAQAVAQALADVAALAATAQQVTDIAEQAKTKLPPDIRIKADGKSIPLRTYLLDRWNALNGPATTSTTPKGENTPDSAPSAHAPAEDGAGQTDTGHAPADTQPEHQAPAGPDPVTEAAAASAERHATAEQEDAEEQAAHAEALSLLLAAGRVYGYTTDAETKIAYRNWTGKSTLDSTAAELRTAADELQQNADDRANGRTSGGDEPADTEPADNAEPLDSEEGWTDEDYAAALEELHSAGSSYYDNPADVEADYLAVHLHPIDAATPGQIRAFAHRISAAAGNSEWTPTPELAHA